MLLRYDTRPGRNYNNIFPYFASIDLPLFSPRFCVVVTIGYLKYTNNNCAFFLEFLSFLFLFFKLNQSSSDLCYVFVCFNPIPIQRASFFPSLSPSLSLSLSSTRLTMILSLFQLY